MHCIDVAICQDNESIDEIKRFGFGVKKYNGCAIIACKKGIRNILIRAGVKTAVFAQTDYFGGCGEQSAKLIQLDNYQDKGKRFKTINAALREMGVEKGDSFDEFEAVGLHKIRENHDLFEKDAV